MSDRFVVLRRLHPAIVAATLCAALLFTFWVRAQSAIRQKSSTYDEPMHALGAWVHWHQGDWRINFEDPPLWQYWAALPNSFESIKFDFRSGYWAKLPQDWDLQWFLTHEVLYRTEGNDGEAFVQRSRSMMIIIGVALGAIIAWWAYQIGGAVAAGVATLFYTLDPNFLAHAPLVKNDVSMALCTAALCMAVWRMGLRLTPWNMLGAACACAAAMTTKFSGVLLGPLFLVMLLTVRVALPRPWMVWKWQVHAWWQRLGVAAGAGLFVAVFSALGVWAAYGFSFPAIPDPSTHLDITKTMQMSKLYQMQARTGGQIDAAAQQDALYSYVRWHLDRFPNDTYFPAQAREIVANVEPWRPPASTRALFWLREHQLMPEAWLDGLLFVEARSYIRGSFLNGQSSTSGFRSYFPLAMAYKTPLATILAIAASAILPILVCGLGRRAPASTRPQSDRWTNVWLACALGLPVLVYMWISIRSNLNIGFRHVLPIYPLIFVGVAWALAEAARRWKRVAAACGLVLGMLLTVESFAIAPDYITFFNAAAGGQRGGMDRLGDSNLDWGQDLKALAEFMKQPQNKDAILYLSYFGMADPQSYGLRYINMPGGYELNPQAIWPRDDSIVAISATKLQGIYLSGDLKEEYAKYRAKTPTAVLGGSMFVYDLRKATKSR